MDFLAIHAAIALTTGFAAFESVAVAIGYALIAIPILSLVVGTKAAIANGLCFNGFTGAQFWFHRRYVSCPDAIAILPVSWRGCAPAFLRGAFDREERNGAAAFGLSKIAR